MKTQSHRIVIPPPLRQYPETKVCRIESCKCDTTEGKPYCTDHTLNHPYVKDLLAKMANRVVEDDNVRRNGSDAVNVDEPGITLQEIIRILKKAKERTEERLERDLQLPRSLIHNYCVALQKRGIVKIKMKPCGRQQVTFLRRDDEDE